MAVYSSSAGFVKKVSVAPWVYICMRPVQIQYCDMHTCTHTCTHTRTHAHTCTHTHTHTHSNTHAHTHTHTHTHTHSQFDICRGQSCILSRPRLGQVRGVSSRPRMGQVRVCEAETKVPPSVIHSPSFVSFPIVCRCRKHGCY